MEFATKVELSRQTICDFERGNATPSPDTLAIIAKALDFPLDFFFRGKPPEICADGASFRSLSTMKASQRDAVLAAGSLALELNDLFSSYFVLPVVDLPDLRDENPKAASISLRAHWGLGERPIRNVVHLLEAHGVRVFSLAEECSTVDAFSLWRDDIPFIFLNTMKTGERGRFDAAHELAHLVLHRHGHTAGRPAEHEANAFASAFLMPSSDVIATAPRLASINQLVQLKTRWGVSVGALARRLYDLMLLSQWQYEQLCIQISQQGWRKREPQGIPRETSKLLGKVFLDLRRSGIGFGAISSKLGISPSELNSLVFQLVLTPVDGGLK